MRSRMQFIREKGRTVAEYRVKWERRYGPIPKEHHLVFINGDERDTRLSNLRLEKDEPRPRRAKPKPREKGAFEMTCQLCGRSFDTDNRQRKYCSKKCKRKQYRLNVKEREK